MTIPMFKNLENIVIPIEESAIDALPLVILISFIFISGLIILKKNYPLLKFGRTTIRILSFILFVFYFHQCICLVREWIFGFQSLGIDQYSAFKRLSVPFILLGGTMILGKIFCGWICPFGFGLELLGKIPVIRKQSRKFQYIYLTFCLFTIIYLLIKNSPDSRYIMENITAVWVLLMTVFLYLVIKNPHKDYRKIRNASLYIWVPSVFIGVYMTNPWCMVYGNELDQASIISLIGVLMTGLLIPSAWCHFACPLGAATSLLSKYSLIKRKDPPPNCYYQRKTSAELTRSECYLCGECTKGLDLEIKASENSNENS